MRLPADNYGKKFSDKFPLRRLDKVASLPNNGYMTNVSDEPKTLYTLLAERRRKIPEVADHLHISRWTVSKWCRGETRPTPYHLDQLRLLLLCSSEELEAALAASRAAYLDGEKADA